MKFEYMREFVVLAELCNYLDAAESLYTSQASLSRHIKAMEDELGGELFTRTTRKVELTSLGTHLLPYARKAVDLQNQYQDAIKKELEIIRSTLVIGVVRRWTNEKLPELLAQYRSYDHSTRIEIKVASVPELKDMLLSGKCNFAFLREFSSKSDDGFIRIPCVQDSVNIYFSENHSFSSSEYVSVEDLKNESFILPSVGGDTYELCMSIFQDAGFEPEFVFRNIDRVTSLDFVSRGLGIAVLPYHSSAELVPGIRYAKLVPERFSYINLIYTKRSIKELDKRFISFIESNSSGKTV